MKQKTKQLIWLFSGLFIWFFTVPLLSGFAESPLKAFGIILAWLLFPLIYIFLTKDFKGVGLTKENFIKAIIGMLVVVIAYSMIRNFLIVFFPFSIQYIAASALTVAELLKQGYFGNISGPFTKLFPIMFFITFLAAISNELFYRGFLFNRLKQFMSWKTAVLVSALLFGIYHYLNVGFSGFIMGFIVSIISGLLMQKYKNIIAPALFHFIQYIITILVFYYYVL